MGTLISILMFIVLAWIVLKIFGLVFHVGIFMLTLPFKILGIIIAVLLLPLILVPLGILAGLAGILMIPFALIGPLLPVALIGLGIWALLRRS
ncbi:MAG: hypothetical protein GXO77_08175 [Calditrichaeota bacterium]|nr:hypothetical protein [Calditrichota bacterium]